MGSGKDEKFLAGKNLGGRPAVVEARVTGPVKPHKPKVLTPQEWKFVEEFCAGDGHVTLKEAAIRAGYSEVWSKNRARELTDPEICPHIVAAIQERRRELGEKYGTTFERHMRDLQVIRDQAWQAGACKAWSRMTWRSSGTRHCRLGPMARPSRPNIAGDRPWGRSTSIARKSGMARLTA